MYTDAYLHGTGICIPYYYTCFSSPITIYTKNITCPLTDKNYTENCTDHFYSLSEHYQHTCLRIVSWKLYIKPYVYLYFKILSQSVNHFLWNYWTKLQQKSVMPITLQDRTQFISSYSFIKLIEILLYKHYFFRHLKILQTLL